MLSYRHPYTSFTGASYTGALYTSHFDQYTSHVDDGKITLPRIPVLCIPVILTGIRGKHYLTVIYALYTGASYTS